jgi:hypothetical protein
MHGCREQAAANFSLSQDKACKLFLFTKTSFFLFFYKNIYARKNLLSLSLFRAAATKE